MKNGLKGIFCLLLFALCSYSQSDKAQSATQVKGIVVDSISREPIEFASIGVYLKNTPQKMEKVLAADIDGKFSFNLNKNGDYIIGIHYVGKETLLTPIRIENEKNIDLGVLEMRNNEAALKEVVVTATKPLVTVDLDKIVYSMEDDPESKTNSAFEMLRKVPMITIDGEENIQLKGSSSYKIFINGKPSNMISSNPKDVLKGMPANSIKNIEVITDPGAKYDAEGIAGIINIITQSQTSLHGYTATLNSRADSQGTFGAGTYFSMKIGKIGFTGNYNYYNYNNPRGTSSSLREDFTLQEDLTLRTDKFLSRTGSNKYKGNGQYGSGELSYEIDTLNLVTVGFNRYGGSSKNNLYNNTFLKLADQTPVYEYDLFSDTKDTYGNTDVNVDYQRISGLVKDRMFTSSYRYSYSPSDWKSTNKYEGIFDYDNELNSQYSDGATKEHTLQLDYTTPFAKIHTLEAGIKYIYRLSESHSGYESYDFVTENWKKRNTPNDKFKHDQHIFSAYAGYSVKYKKFGFKSGVRLEATDLKAKYPIDNKRDFKTDYSNLVPSATLSYQLSQMKTLRVGYNMRIRRPGISQLNPFVNSTDTNYIKVGNPNLDAVKSHNVNLNYSSFSRTLQLNASVAYNFANNDIQGITTILDGISKTTYANIGKSSNINVFMYVNWTPIKNLRFNTNMSGRYVDLKANNELKLANHGFEGSIFGNIQYTVPNWFSKKEQPGDLVRLSIHGGYGSQRISLQGGSGSFHFTNVSVSKSFLKDKLTANVFVSNPFTKERSYKTWESTEAYNFESSSYIKARRVGFSISYRFGEMKTQIKKAQRGITNDDAMGGGNSGGQQEGGQGGN